ncbi:MAG: sugar ABC transporter substrate-binding protein [Microbacterium sp.]
MKHSIVFAAGGMLSVACLLSGCGLGGGTASSDGSASDGEVTGEITFQTWNLKANYQDFFDGVIQAFEEEYPGTSVNWIDQPAEGYADKLSADAAAGTLPDVMDLDPGGAYPLAQAGLLMNVAEEDPEAQDLYLPSAWEAGDWTALGGTFGYPWYLSTGPSMFNTALFEQAGLDTSSLPQTYDDLFAQATEMAEAVGGQYAMLGQPPTIEEFGMYGVQLMNDDQTEFVFNNADGVELVQHYIDLYESGGFLAESLSSDFTGVNESFQAGKIAYMPGSAYNVQALQENAPSVFENLQLAPLITNEKPNMYVHLLGVSEQSENKSTAKEFARWVSNAENQLGFAKVVNVFPSTIGTIEDDFFTTSDGSANDEVRVTSAAQLADAVAYQPGSFTDAMKSELRDQIALAMLGKQSAQDALDAVVEYSNQRISG